MKLINQLNLYYTYSIFKNLVFQRGIFMIFLVEKGISVFQIGILQATLFLTTFLAEVPAGYFGDKFKRKKSIILGLSLKILAGLGFIFFDTFYAFLVLFFLEGLGMAFISGSDESLLYDNIKGKGNHDESLFLKAVSKSNSFSLYALGASTLLGGLLQKVSWNYVYGGFSVAMVLALFAIMFIHEDTSAYKSNHTDIGTKEKEKTRAKAFLRSDTGKHLLVLMIIIAVFDSALLNFFMFSQKLFHHFQIDISIIAILYTISRFTSGAGYTLAPKLSKKLSISALATISMLSCSVLLSLNIFTNIYISAIIFLTFMIIPNVFDALFSNYMNKLIPSEIRATVISTRSMLASGIVSIFYLGFGKMLDIVSPPLAMATLSIVPIICLIALYFTKGFSHENA